MPPNGEFNFFLWLVFATLHRPPLYLLCLPKVQRGDTNKTPCYVKTQQPHESLAGFTYKWKCCHDAQIF